MYGVRLFLCDWILLLSIICRQCIVDHMSKIKILIQLPTCYRTNNKTNMIPHCLYKDSSNSLLNFNILMHQVMLMLVMNNVSFNDSLVILVQLCGSLCCFSALNATCLPYAATFHSFLKYSHDFLLDATWAVFWVLSLDEQYV